LQIDDDERRCALAERRVGGLAGRRLDDLEARLAQERREPKAQLVVVFDDEDSLLHRAACHRATPHECFETFCLWQYFTFHTDSASRRARFASLGRALGQARHPSEKIGQLCLRPFASPDPISDFRTTDSGFRTPRAAIRRRASWVVMGMVDATRP